MTIRIAGISFDDNFYDADADVLYMSAGPPRASTGADTSPEGHAIRWNEARIIGITVINARWYVERDGKLVITIPPRVEVPPAELSEILGLERPRVP